MDVKEVSANFFKKIPEPVRFLILVVILGAICLVYFMTTYSQKTGRIRELQGELDKLEQTLRENKAVADNLPEFKRELAKTELKLKEARTMLPNEAELPAFMKNLSNLGTDSGLEFSTFRPQQETREKFYSQVPIQLQLRGTYHSFLSFCDKVSRLSRIVNITEVNLSATNKKKASGEMELNISCLATTYRFIEEAEGEKKDEGKKDAGKKDQGKKKDADKKEGEKI